ncbi:hypothetical protein CEE39_03295 [bacterium (candidate division B38) B3_B38]|nr:MAG: hypothetical protein CEE39_03295 [bacterium (candidate division B38) B3_B38]
MRRVLTSGIFVVFCFLTVVILAQVPQLLNYQGRLTDDKGIPITTATTLRFSLYQGGDAATPGSGTLCYQEDASVTPDDNGVFSHLIGSGTVIYGALDATVFQTADPVYLEIAIDPAGANETLLPRKQIVTVGYSYKSELADDADTVDGQEASAFAPVVHNHDPDYVNEGQVNSVDSSMIVNGTIVDADINAGANISASKINTTGLDADLLDGKDSEDFVHTTGDDMTGTLSVVTSSSQALYGTTTSTSGSTYGVHGRSDSTMGNGVYGRATATSGVNYGVRGISNSPWGYGVYGYAAATEGINHGVYGSTPSISTNASGVYGYATANSGKNHGVYGKSNSTLGRGVFGTAPNYGLYGEATATTGISYGLYGESASTGGRGVYGYADATSGTTYGVYGISDSSSNYASGVYGQNTATGGNTCGVWGASNSTSGTGVVGHAAATEGINHGVYGKTDSPEGTGVYGIGPNYGVYAMASATSGANVGVYGITNSPNGAAVYGVAAATGSGSNYGVYGESKSSYILSAAVYGKAPTIAIMGHSLGTSISSIGVYGVTDDRGFGVFGAGGADAYAGYFGGKVHVTGDFTVGGAKTCVQPIDNGKKVLLYAMESPEIWFEDFGTGKLVNGQAVVQLESVFTQAANTEIAYFVFPIPNGDCQGLYISRKDKVSFEVRELGDGTSNISFDYRIVAKRRGYEEVRFEEFTEPEQPPAEPNLPIEKK